MNNPKYSLELEQRVLETLMHFGDHNHARVQKAFLTLTGDCFYNVDNKILFAMIRDCFNKQESFSFVDILVLVPKEQTEVYASLSWIIDNYGKFHTSESGFENDINRLITFTQLRKQLNLSEKMINEVQHCPNPEQSQEIMMQSLSEISNLSYRASKHGISNIEIAESFYDGKLVQPTPILTTSQSLNTALCGGIMPKSLIIVAAGASVGKTSFSIFLMDCIARSQTGHEALFFSIEMEYKHIWMRHVGICAGKQFDRLTNDERLTGVAKSFEVPIKIYDAAMCRSVADIDFILTTARLRSKEVPISVIVVDYLGLVQNKGHFERNDLKQADITSKLAQLAIELNCTVIALSQINRGASNRAIEDRCPWPHDAADSSGGHRSASLWLGVDRPELYQVDPFYKNQFVVKCRKNRFGEVFELIYRFNEGTFAESSNEWTHKPQVNKKCPEKAIFYPHRDDFYENQ